MDEFRDEGTVCVLKSTALYPLCEADVLALLHRWLHICE
jgi:hypothetical protein